jgi:RHS repeat-associated protein
VLLEETYNASTSAMTVTQVYGYAADGLRSRYEAGSSLAYDYLYDPQGNVVQRQTYQNAENGEPVVTQAIYDAYGALRSNVLISTDATKGADEVGFGGQYGYYTDPETGLVLCTHRYYDPGTGRWLTRDPISYKGGMNLYSYAGGNPINEIDPDGTSYVDYLKGIGDSLNPVNAAKGVVALGKYLASGHASAKALGHAFVQSINPADPYINDREMGRRATNLVGIVVAASKGVGAVGGALKGASAAEAVAGATSGAAESAEALLQLRSAYVSEVEGLKTVGQKMLAEGEDVEVVARRLNAARRAIGVKYKNKTPEALREKIYERNMKLYGDPLGPTADFLHINMKKSWDQIIESSSRTGGKDLGL